MVSSPLEPKRVRGRELGPREETHADTVQPLLGSSTAVPSLTRDVCERRETERPAKEKDLVNDASTRSATEMNNKK